MCVSTCSQERIAVETDNDVIAVDAKNDRWYVKLSTGDFFTNDDQSQKSSSSASNDSESSASSSCASAIGKPSRLPPGILLGQKPTKEDNNSAEQSQRLLGNTRHQFMLTQSKREAEDEQVLEQARLFKEKIKSAAKVKPQKYR